MLAFTAVLFATGCSEAYDDSALIGRVDGLENRVEKLEQQCNQMNTNIASLQTIVNALQKNVTISNVSPITEGGTTIGYTIKFSDGTSITIYNGKDGKDGEDGTNGDGAAPTIGVELDTDGCYYWTLNGEWLLDKNGNKIKAQGSDGKDGTDGDDGKDGQDGVNGTNGTNGTDGKDGKDGITPKLKIENDYWHVSYDNGETWVKVGKATGGSNGGGNINGIDIDETDTHVTFILSSGSVITLPKDGAFINFLDNTVEVLCVLYWDTDGDGKLSYDEAAAVTDLEDAFTGSSISVFNELRYFTGLQSISNDAFNGSSLAQTVLPENITSIGESAFYWTHIKNINIPEKVTKIGSYAFADCYKLRNITVPDNVTEIGEGAFCNCDTLSQAILPKDLKVIESRLFEGCYNLTPVIIPNGVTDIKSAAFEYCYLIEEITIPEDVKSIGDNAFAGCKSLKEITIPESVESIGDSAFYGCRNLKDITIHEGVKTIGNSAFGNSGLTNITLPNSVTEIGAYLFESCANLTNATLPENINILPAYTFDGCTSLTDISNIMKNIIYFGNDPFRGCTSLTTVVLPAHFKGCYSGYQHSVFMKCANLKSLTITSPTAPNISLEIGYEYDYQSIYNDETGEYTMVEVLISTPIETITFTEDVKSLGAFQCISAGYEDSVRSLQAINLKSKSLVKIEAAEHEIEGYSDRYINFDRDFFYKYNSEMDIYEKACKIYVPSSLLEEYLTDTYWYALYGEYFAENFEGVDF